jgi:hypothetical protein
MGRGDLSQDVLPVKLCLSPYRIGADQDALAELVETPGWAGLVFNAIDGSNRDGEDRAGSIAPKRCGSKLNEGSGFSSARRVQDHLRATKQRDRAPGCLIRDGAIPNLSAPTLVRGDRDADDSLALASAAEEVGLELDGGEALGFTRPTPTDADRGQRIGQGDHGWGEEVARAGYERRGHVHVTHNTLRSDLDSLDAEDSRDAAREELVQPSDFIVGHRQLLSTKEERVEARSLDRGAGRPDSAAPA